MCYAICNDVNKFSLIKITYVDEQYNIENYISLVTIMIFLRKCMWEIIFMCYLCLVINNLCVVWKSS